LNIFDKVTLHVVVHMSQVLCCPVCSLDSRVALDSVSCKPVA